MPKFKIAVQWIMLGEYEIEADTLEQAKEKALGPDTPLPSDGYYLDDSMVVTTCWIDGEWSQDDEPAETTSSRPSAQKQKQTSMKVYHRRHPDFLAENKPSWPSDQYELVAEVICDSLEQAFEFTNHIDTNWAKNPGVTAFGNYRSTSVGDVVVDNNGKPWWCKSMGWEELPCKV